MTADASNPDVTVTCSFLDLDNGYEDFALVPLGQSVATSPRKYDSGTRLLVTATLTKNDNTFLSLKKEVTLTATQLIPFQLRAASGGSGDSAGVGQLNGNQSGDSGGGESATFFRHLRGKHLRSSKK